MRNGMRIYHNPRCSKSRQALQLLRDAGVESDIVEYLKTPLTAGELESLCVALKRDPQAIVRFGEDRAKELGLKAGDARTRSEWLRLLADNPVLIERPIVVDGARAVLGRPPENVSALLK